jgi:hypothetical protein
MLAGYWVQGAVSLREELAAATCELRYGFSVCDNNVTCFAAVPSVSKVRQVHRPVVHCWCVGAVERLLGREGAAGCEGGSCAALQPVS